MISVILFLTFLEARASHGPGLSVTLSVCLSVRHTLADICSVKPCLVLYGPVLDIGYYILDI